MPRSSADIQVGQELGFDRLLFTSCIKHLAVDRQVWYELAALRCRSLCTQRPHSLRIMSKPMLVSLTNRNHASSACEKISPGHLEEGFGACCYVEVQICMWNHSTVRLKHAFYLLPLTALASVCLCWRYESASVRAVRYFQWKRSVCNV